MLKGHGKEYARGTRRHHWSGKFPMDKFLQSRLGQPWSKIYSELSQEFDRRTYSGYLFWRCFESRWCPTVTMKCWKGAESGKIYNSEGMEVHGFYVHPFSNCLEYKKPEAYKSREPRQITRHIIDKESAFEKVDGIWYYVKYKPTDYRFLSYNIRRYKDGFELLSKRQLSGKELKANNLINDSSEKIEELMEVAEQKYKEAKEHASTIGFLFAKTVSDFYGE